MEHDQCSVSFPWFEGSCPLLTDSRRRPGNTLIDSSIEEGLVLVEGVVARGRVGGGDISGGVNMNRSPNLTPTILDYSTLASLITCFTDRSFVNPHHVLPTNNRHPNTEYLPSPQSRRPPPSPPSPCPLPLLPYQKYTLASQLHELRRLMKIPRKTF